jgi:hypothetical protein
VNQSVNGRSSEAANRLVESTDSTLKRQGVDSLRPPHSSLQLQIQMRWSDSICTVLPTENRASQPHPTDRR